jgi:hypothetical protein
MRVSGNKFLTSLILVFGLMINNSLIAHSVEFGQDATGDPNAVKVGGASGFLYSERIVITVAHVIESTGGLARWEREGVIYNPGIVFVDGQKTYKVKKVLIPDTYVTPDYQKNVVIDDLAIIILSEDIPMTKRAVLATEEQMKRFVREKSKVELVGYGIRSGSERNLLGQKNNRPPTKLTSTLSSPDMVIEFYKKNERSIDWKWINIPGVYGILQHRELQQSHICEGDSGSVFFVEEDNIRYVLGTTGLGIINNNCPPPGWKFYPSISMSWIDPKSKLTELLKTAEKIVEEDKKLGFIPEADAKTRYEADVQAKLEADAKARAEASARGAEELKAIQEAEAKAKQESEAKAAAELKAKQEAETKAAATKKTTIACVKGKLVKKVTAINPKCPKRYKKK